MLISVEGLDGVGKSSLVNSVSRKLQIPIIAKPIKSILELNPSQASKIKEKIYSKYSSNVQAMYYLLGYLSALEDGKKHDYIFDRGFLSTYYFSYCNENSHLFDFFAHEYGFPDLTILLYASIEKRIQRIEMRDNQDKDLQKNRIYVDNYQKMFEAIIKYNIPHIAINTEKLTQKETCDLILEILNLWKLDEENRNYILNNYSIYNLSENEKLSYQDQIESLTNYHPDQKKYIRK